jgi:SAM-dependent methyltransferase
MSGLKGEKLKKTIGEITRRIILRLIKIPVQRQRSNLLNLFLQTFDLEKKTSLIDIGGTTEGFESIGISCRAMAVNIEVRKMMEGWNLIIADGRLLPFKDKSVDIIMSNALLEHVNEGREKLVREIKRVSKGNYFISVPYLYSPFEPHYLIPLFQFVPESVKRFLLFRVGLTIGWMSKENYHEIKLFKKSQLRELFPEAKTCFLRAFGIPVCLVAWSKGQ